MRLGYWCVLLIAAFFAQAAAAHPGAGVDGFGRGALHTLLGVDHVLAIIAVGLWSAQLGAAARWQFPLAFVVMMLASVLAASAGLALPLVEAGIAASLLVLGLLIVFLVRLPPAAGIALVAAFAIFHGHAHGQWLAGAAPLIGLGMTTLALHAGGLLLGISLDRRLVRLAGVGIAMSAVAVGL